MDEVPLYAPPLPLHPQPVGGALHPEYLHATKAVIPPCSIAFVAWSHFDLAAMFKRHLPDIAQWNRAVAPTSSRGGLVLA